MKLFLSPHNDDETLFGAFTIMRERPTVCVVFDSYVQPSRGIRGCEAHIRKSETLLALRELTEGPFCVVPEVFLRLSDINDWTNDVYKISNTLSLFKQVEEVWAPAFEHDGHTHHNVVAQAADVAFPGKVTHYLTYTRTNGKSRSNVEVKPRTGDDIARKLKALACYKSQLQMIDRLGCWPHFMNDLREYYVS